jgi:aspartate kinase
MRRMLPGRRGDNPEKIIVLKIGGSIFTGPEAYRRAARFIRDRLHAVMDERYVTVVSAQNGTTDGHQRVANRIVRAPDARALDLLWATGELRSVALLTMHLHGLGISAVGLNVHETGLRILNSPNGDGGIEFQSNQIERALSRCSVVVAPGFLATKIDGSIVSLGRGGSDLTAVLLARNLDATRCELVKDVPGYFTSDPNRDRAARHIPFLTYHRALAMADDGCDLVQRKAIEAASNSDLPLLIRSIDQTNIVSVISSRPPKKGDG